MTASTVHATASMVHATILTPGSECTPYLKVPVEEPAAVRAQPSGSSAQSLEQWVQSPGNVMGRVALTPGCQIGYMDHPAYWLSSAG